MLNKDSLSHYQIFMEEAKSSWSPDFGKNFNVYNTMDNHDKWKGLSIWVSGRMGRE